MSPCFTATDSGSSLRGSPYGKQVCSHLTFQLTQSLVLPTAEGLLRTEILSTQNGQAYGAISRARIAGKSLRMPGLNEPHVNDCVITSHVVTSLDDALTSLASRPAVLRHGSQGKCSRGARWCWNTNTAQRKHANFPKDSPVQSSVSRPAATSLERLQLMTPLYHISLKIDLVLFLNAQDGGRFHFKEAFVLQDKK